MSCIRYKKWVFLVAWLLLLTLTGCEVVGIPSVSGQSATVRPRMTATPAPVLTNSPAMLYSSVLTDKRVISIILEGYTDITTMNSVIDIFAKNRIPCVFFISGITANEQPEIVRRIAAAQLTIGNYGINARKGMEENDVYTNIHQFQRGQELIYESCGITPTLCRCNGSEYTDAVLRAASYAGLQAAVKPTVYLNHRSFTKKEDALLFVQKMVRGSILSIKLGQELDVSEYGDVGEALDERPAVDPPPGIEDDAVDTTEWTYANIVNVIEWLFEALNEEGYMVLSTEALQGEALSMYEYKRALSEQEEALLDTDSYAVPNTPESLGVPAGATALDSAFDGAVFVGDSVTAMLEDYVLWRRESVPTYLGTAQFLTSSALGIGTALMSVSSTSAHPEWNGEKTTVEATLQKMGARKVFLMLGLNDIRGYSQDALVQNLQLLIYMIRSANPNAEVYVQSILPGTAGRYTAPTNAQIFKYNLAICRFCLEYDVPYIDVAFTLRDAAGDLDPNFCFDPDSYGTHLNDAGCERWIGYLKNHMP